MPTSPEDWQRRLDYHFTQLARSRANSGLPIFALEHGLIRDEINEISLHLRERISLGLGLDGFWLLWVIYATEIGYDYEGDEYWDSFERRTPRWRDRGSRDDLREWFGKFRRKYNGVAPIGSWADCFRIIAWPITHAILPRYLQWQFAQTVYNLRYHFAELRDRTPVVVGQLIARHAFDTSSRFQQFVQQEELVGRIALALIGKGEVSGQASIHLATLERLVTDLGRTQSAREWLNETRNYLADKLIDVARANIGSSPDSASATVALDTPKTATLRPQRTLQLSGKSEWSVVLTIPNFGPYARFDGELRTFLLKTRCKIACIGDSWMPQAWLLSGPHRRNARWWPGSEELFTFERLNATCLSLISTETHLPDGPFWLFRIGSDGTAREIIGKTIRPNKKYILVSDRRSALQSSFLEDCEIRCNGVSAAQISMPAVPSAEMIGLLEKIGMQVQKSIRVLPVGLTPRNWDGEGRGEWLTSDRPCFGIVNDHPVESFGVRLDDGPELSIKASPTRNVTFISLASLSSGQHKLTVTARRNSQFSGSSTENTTVVTLSAREPEPWIPGTTSHSGLFVSVEPYNPLLDSFWAGDVAVSIMGPPGRQVTCGMKLVTPKGEEVLSERIGTFDLPVSKETWQRRFSDFTSSQNRESLYQESSSGRLLVHEDELGEFVLRLERDIKPLRWVTRSANRATIARLIDDTGLDSSVSCQYLSFQLPAVRCDLEIDRAFSAIQTSDAGGLFYARQAAWEDSIVVSTPTVQKGFRGLVIEPDLAILDRDGHNINLTLDVLRTWMRARLFGPLALVRRRHVVTCLRQHFYKRLCGQAWAEAESAFTANSSSEATLKRLQHAVGATGGFSVLLRRDYQTYALDLSEGAEWFVDVAHRYQICSDRGLSEFAFRLGTQPQELLSLPRAALDPLFTEIKQRPVLLRGARFLGLLSESAQVVKV